jgi:hypothetical protein
MIIYFSECVCKKLCVKVLFTSYNFPKKRKLQRKQFRKRKDSWCRRSRARSAPEARSLISGPPFLFFSFSHQERRSLNALCYPSALFALERMNSIIAIYISQALPSPHCYLHTAGAILYPCKLKVTRRSHYTNISDHNILVLRRLPRSSKTARDG